MFEMNERITRLVLNQSYAQKDRNKCYFFIATLNSFASFRNYFWINLRKKLAGYEKMCFN